MILLIEENNGEQYEDYYSWVERVYDVDTNKTPEELETEWKKEIAEVMLNNRITINKNWVHVIMDESKIKNKKLHKSILKENDFYTWLEKTYKTKKLKFGVVHKP